jgi:hypothetical protein
LPGAGRGEGLDLAKEIACRALLRQTELCAPYSEVIDIDPRQLPTAREVRQWDSEAFVAHTRHRQQEPRYNPMFRQLLHVAYGVAAEMGETFYGRWTTTGRPSLRAYAKIFSRTMYDSFFTCERVNVSTC